MVFTQFFDMLRDNLVTPRTFLETDPWLFSVLNTSLTTMKLRDEQLADAIDAGGGLGGVIIDIVGGTPTINRLPAGWSVSKVGTGGYQLTHNFGVASYTVFPGVVSSSLASITVSEISTNSFKVNTFDSVGAPVDIRFSCFVTRYA